MATPKPTYEDFLTDESCPECKRKSLWYDFHIYTTFCSSCSYSWHDVAAEIRAENTVQDELARVFGWDESHPDDDDDGDDDDGERNTAFVNLTSHTLNIARADGEMVEIPPSGTVARLESRKEDRESCAGFAVTRETLGEPFAVQSGSDEKMPFPEEKKGTIYFVSRMMLASLAGRNDVFAPGEPIRDVDGKIVGAKGLTATPASVS